MQETCRCRQFPAYNRDLDPDCPTGHDPMPRPVSSAFALARHALVCLLLLCCASALAQAPHSLRFEQLGVEQGLAQESVSAAVQDRQGFMWFGSQAGLSRYD